MDTHPNMRVRVLPVKLAIDLVTESVIDLFDLEVESGSPGSDLTFVAVSIWFMDLVFTIIVVSYTVSLVSVASAGLSWALSWIFLPMCFARCQSGMASSNNGGRISNLILGFPPVDQPRNVVPTTARM